MSNTCAELALTMSSRMDEIDGCRSSLAEFCACHGFDDHARAILTLIIEEMITNTVTHGGVQPEATIEIRLAHAGKAVTVDYTDRGQPFDPRSDLPADRHSETVEERPVGQLGWALILHYCRLVDYRRDSDANRITLETAFPLTKFRGQYT